jgi:hypothetical protein
MDIKLSPQHGINPAIPVCFFCNMPKAEIILAGKLPGDVEAPRNAVWDKQPCRRCQSIMEQAIILISIDEKLTKDSSNPYRTGGWLAIKEEAVKRMGIQPQVVNSILRARVAFIPDETWNLMGLPRGGVKGVAGEMPKDDQPVQFGAAT